MPSVPILSRARLAQWTSGGRRPRAATTPGE
jgi:hypothetical protein